MGNTLQFVAVYACLLPRINLQFQGGRNTTRCKVSPCANQLTVSNSDIKVWGKNRMDREEAAKKADDLKSSLLKLNSEFCLGYSICIY